MVVLDKYCLFYWETWVLKKVKEQFLKQKEIAKFWPIPDPKAPLQTLFPLSLIFQAVTHNLLLLPQGSLGRIDKTGHVFAQTDFTSSQPGQGHNDELFSQCWGLHFCFYQCKQTRDSENLVIQWIFQLLTPLVKHDIFWFSFFTPNLAGIHVLINKDTY